MIHAFGARAVLANDVVFVAQELPSGAAGRLALDLTAMPGSPPTSVAPGET